jgi:hypothetical protein
MSFSSDRPRLRLPLGAAARVSVAALGLTAVLAALAAPIALAAPEKNRNHFDSDAPFRPPGFFDFVVLGPAGDALWNVVADSNPPSAPNVVSQIFTKRPANSIAAAIRRNVRLTDGTLTVAIKKLSSHAGLIFRLTDDRTGFLALLVDPVAGDASLTRWDKGRSTELAHGRVATDRPWGTLAVRFAGEKITATWNGEPLLEATGAPAVEGRTGIATAGPGLTAFDEFVIEPAN